MSKALGSNLAISTLVKLTSEKEKKKKGKKFTGQKVPLNKLTGKLLKKTKKKEYTQMLGSNIQEFIGEVKKLYCAKKGKKSKLFDDKEDLFEILTNKKFCKSLCSVMKEYEDTDMGIPDILLVAIGDMFVEGAEGFSDKEISKPYLKLVDAAKSKQIKKVAKELDLKKEDQPKGKALGLVLTSISVEGMSGKNSIKRINMFLNLLTQIPELDEKKVKEIIKLCYKKKSLKFFLGIALNEKPKKDNENFSIITNGILKILEKMDKEERNDILKAYAKRRKEMDCKCPRRVNLLSINEEDYKGINKSVAKLMRSGYKREIFS